MSSNHQYFDMKTWCDYSTHSEKDISKFLNVQIMQSNSLLISLSWITQNYCPIQSKISMFRITMIIYIF